MDTNTKEDIVKMRSLIERMGSKQTYTQAMITEEKMIKEAVKPNAKAVTRNDIIDIMAQHKDEGDTKMFSFIYVKPEKIMKTKQNWRTDDVTKTLANYNSEGNEHWFNDLATINDPNFIGRKAKSPFAGVVVTQRYVLSMAGFSKFGERYEAYADKLHTLRMRHGLGMDSNGMLGDYHAPANDDLNLMMDMAAQNKNLFRSTCYLVDENGNIKGKMPEDVVASISASKKSYGGPEKSAIEGIDDDELLQAYTKAKSELDKTFNAKKFLFDRILAIVATIDGQSYYYINDALKTPIFDKSDINVNTDEMIKIAQDQLGATLDAIQGFES